MTGHAGDSGVPYGGRRILARFACAWSNILRGTRPITGAQKDMCFCVLKGVGTRLADGRTFVLKPGNELSRMATRPIDVSVVPVPSCLSSTERFLAVLSLDGLVDTFRAAPVLGLLLISSVSRTGSEQFACGSRCVRGHAYWRRQITCVINRREQ